MRFVNQVKGIAVLQTQGLKVGTSTTMDETIIGASNCNPNGNRPTQRSA